MSTSEECFERPNIGDRCGDAIQPLSLPSDPSPICDSDEQSFLRGRAAAREYRRIIRQQRLVVGGCPDVRLLRNGRDRDNVGESDGRYIRGTACTNITHVPWLNVSGVEECGRLLAAGKTW